MSAFRSQTLAALAPLTSLTSLDLFSCRLNTDAGVGALATLTSLNVHWDDPDDDDSDDH